MYKTTAYFQCKWKNTEWTKTAVRFCKLLSSTFQSEGDSPYKTTNHGHLSVPQAKHNADNPCPELFRFTSSPPAPLNTQHANQHHSRLRNQVKCIQRVDCVYALCSFPHFAIFPSFHPNPTETLLWTQRVEFKKYHCSARTPTLISITPPVSITVGHAGVIIPNSMLSGNPRFLHYFNRNF